MRDGAERNVTVSDRHGLAHREWTTSIGADCSAACCGLLPRTDVAKVLELSPAVWIREAEWLSRAHMLMPLAKDVYAGVMDG